MYIGKEYEELKFLVKKYTETELDTDPKSVSLQTFYSITDLTQVNIEQRLFIKEKEEEEFKLNADAYRDYLKFNYLFNMLMAKRTSEKGEYL